MAANASSSSDLLVAVLAGQLVQVEPGGGEDVQGQREQQEEDGRANEPPSAVGDGQGGAEQGQAVGGDADDEGDPGRGVWLLTGW